MKPDYRRLLENKQKELIDFIMAPKIDEFQFKSIIEGFRSILDYLSNDINNILVDKIKKPQFPIVIEFKDLQSNHFLNKLKAERSDLYDLLIQIQPYNSENKWLGNIAMLTNHSKHNGLPIVNQKKSLILDRFIEVSDDSKFEGKSVTFGDITYKNLKVDGLDVVYDNMSEIENKFEIINNSIVRFNNKDYNAKQFLATCLNNLVNFIAAYEKLL